MLVKGCSLIVSEPSEVFLADNVWIIYCPNLNNLCMNQCRVLIAITMCSSAVMSYIWSWMPIMLYSLGSAFHLSFSQRILRKGRWLRAWAKLPSEVLSFFLKIFISLLLFFISKSEIQSCMLLCCRDKARACKCLRLGRKDFSTCLVKEQLLSAIISRSHSPGM